MTLILTLVNSEQVIQISDRRLSWDGELVDDESNKAGVFLCADARHVFGFTGLAKCDTFDTRRWLLNALYECCAPDYQINKIMPRLKTRANEDFQNLPVLGELDPRRKRLSIMFSGYNYYANPPLSAYGILTNYQNFATGKDDTNAWDHFEMNCWTEKRPLDRPCTLIQRIGNWAAMTNEDEIALRKMLRESKPLAAIADKAVTLVREMAGRPRANGTIGRQISVVALHRDKTAEVWSRYYPESAGHQMYVPDLVVGINKLRRQAIADLSCSMDTETGPELWAIPIVHKNAPCPCNGGKRYKECHGRTGSPRTTRGGARIPKAKTMRVGLRVRHEHGVDLTDEEMLKLLGEQWLLFAALAYGEYLQKGRGAIFINLADSNTTGRGIVIDPVYVAENSEELKRRGGWPHDEGEKTIKLISSYDPEQMIIFILSHKSGRINTMYMASKDSNLTPRILHKGRGSSSSSRRHAVVLG